MDIFELFFGEKSDSYLQTLSKSGIEKYYREDYVGAIQDFSNAIQLFPDNPILYLMRGTAHLDGGNTFHAEKDLFSALNLDKSNYLILYRLGMLLHKRRDRDSGLRFLIDSYDTHQSEDFEKWGLGEKKMLFVSKRTIALNIGGFLIDVQRFEEGLSYLEKAIEHDPNDPNSYHIKGMSLAKIGRIREGIDYVKKAVQLGSPTAEWSLKALEQIL